LFSLVFLNGTNIVSNWSYLTEGGVFD
jgi:hypothetical protein